MYYNGTLNNLFGTCTAFIGNRESGKTTILKNILGLAIEKNLSILLFDSATDHATKSLLVYALRMYPNSQIILSPEKDKINLEPTSVSANDYPADIVYPQHKNLFLFDVSKYLEEGYETEDLVKRNQIREYYKRLVFQELAVMESLVTTQKTLILMDEIELLDDMKHILERYKAIGTTIIVALHEKDSLATCDSVFNIINL